MKNEKATLKLDDYVDHILLGIKKIKAYTQKCNMETFCENEMMVDAVLKNLENIGEASNSLMLFYADQIDGSDLQSLKQAYSARNVLTHAYYKVNPIIVWDTIQNDIPQFEVMINGLIEKFHPILHHDSQIFDTVSLEIQQSFPNEEAERLRAQQAADASRKATSGHTDDDAP